MISNSLIHNLPMEDRPRERLISKGAKVLSNSELLAIILRTGSKEQSAIQLAGNLLANCDGIAGLSKLEVAELEQVKGIGKSKACQIIASFELAKRINNSSNSNAFSFSAPVDVYNYVVTEIGFEDREHFVVIGLNTKNQIIGKYIVSVGTLNQTLVHPREVFAWAIKHKCAAIIVAHNHPSGSVEPSDEDLRLTERIIDAGRIIGIELLDHVVVSRDAYYSLKANGNM